MDDRPRAVPLYASPAYAKTLAHVGAARFVAEWGTCVIVRDIDGIDRDAMGPYPITCLAADGDVAAGLNALRNEGLVSVALVVDGLVGRPIADVAPAFDLARPFKTHYLVDPAAGPYSPSAHHRYEVRRAAQRGVEVRSVALHDILSEWSALYAELVELHRISGVQRFTHDSFALLADCEELTAVAAFMGGELVSCHLWVGDGPVVWSHLAASNARGYANGAAYAVYDWSIRQFAGRLVNLGGAAGGDDAQSGLARFKAGFSNRQHRSWLLGSVLRPQAYQALRARRGASATDYFPAYRAPREAAAEVPVPGARGGDA